MITLCRSWLSRRCLSPLLIGLLLVSPILAEQVSTLEVTGTVMPAFPGAEGFGATTPGGRGGRVIEVTNLNDSGSGSLRACAEASEPRVCVFRVAGIIEVQSRINIWNPYMTIAGQTAPGDGITLKNGSMNLQAPLGVLTHDVVIRYIRSRPGPSDVPSSTVDAITIVHEADLDHPNDGVYNVVIDHASFSWSTDEVVNTAADVYDITIQWSIVSEGLNCSSHSAGCNSKGMLIGAAGARDISLHHNLLAHNKGRNPLLNTSGVVDVVNNVVYVPANTGGSVSGRYGKIPVNFVGNYGMTHPSNNDNLMYLVRRLEKKLDASIYVLGNIDPNRTQNDQEEALVVEPESRRYIVANRHDAPVVTTTSAFEAFDQVLAQAGATQGLSDTGEFFWRRDMVDERIVNDTQHGMGGLINHPADVGGWPEHVPGIPYVDADHDGMADDWEALHHLDPYNTFDNNRDADADGYTNLEEFLNGTDPNQP